MASLMNTGRPQLAASLSSEFKFKFLKKAFQAGFFSIVIVEGFWLGHFNIRNSRNSTKSLGSVAVHFSEQHFLDAALDISIVRKSGAPRFEHGAAGREAQTLPLCYAAPLRMILNL